MLTRQARKVRNKHLLHLRVVVVVVGGGPGLVLQFCPDLLLSLLNTTEQILHLSKAMFFSPAVVELTVCASGEGHYQTE